MSCYTLLSMRRINLTSIWPNYLVVRAHLTLHPRSNWNNPSTLGRLKKVLWRQSKSVTEEENARCRKIGAPNTGLFRQHISDTMSTVLSIWGESPSFKEAGFSPEAGGEFDIVFMGTIESPKKVFALVLGYFRSLFNSSANGRNDRTLNLKQFAAVVTGASRLWTEQTLLTWITSLKSNPMPLAQVMSDCACWVTASTVSVLYSIYAEATDPQYAPPSKSLVIL